MTLTDELKVLDDKNKANQARYILDREAAKISVLSSGELGKYGYLTGEDLRYKPGVVEKTKFEYSPLGKDFDKGLNEKDKKEGLLKRLKNIGNKNEKQLNNQLKLVENDSGNKKPFKRLKFLEISQDAKETLAKLKDINDEIDYRKLVCVRTNERVYDFHIFRKLADLSRNIYHGDILIEQAKSRRNEMENLLSSLTRYRQQNKNNTKNNISENLKKHFIG